MYDAIAIAFILAVSGILWMAFNWAKARGYIQKTGMLRLTLGVFALVFVSQLIQTIGDPFPRDTFDLTLQWAVLVSSLAVVIVSGIKLVRAR